MVFFYQSRFLLFLIFFVGRDVQINFFFFLRTSFNSSQKVVIFLSYSIFSNKCFIKLNGYSKIKNHKLKVEPLRKELYFLKKYESQDKFKLANWFFDKFDSTH